MKKSLLVAFFSLFMIGALICGFIAYHFVNTKPSGDESPVVFEVAFGKSFRTIAEELEQKRLIQNAKLFTLFARLRGGTARMKVGEYILRRNMTPAQVLAVITSGKSRGRAFTVAEGLNLFEIADLYEQGGFGDKSVFLGLCRDRQFIKSLLGVERDSLEGYLFPETYQLTKYTSAKDLLKSMVSRFQLVYKEVLPESEIDNSLNQHQIVTLASIIEKETGAPHERPRISSVFHNRLKKGMRLQTDPTIIYGIAEKDGKTIYKISRADISTPTRYNTYVIRGLPPGPIANPGREALLAAVRPEQTEDLFFVSQNDGTHVFSNDYETHAKAVRKFQGDAKARQGKSWRDLPKSGQR